MLEKELETAIALARAAGKVILEYYALEIIVEQKLGIDNQTEPVTIADLAASKIIVEGLTGIFPDDGILSEEETDDVGGRLSKNRVWIVDPLDGTAGFVKKDGDFAVQIGLAENGEPVLGVVFLPFHNTLYFASKGQGAFAIENSDPPKRLQVSAKIDFAEMSIAVSRDHRSPRMSYILENFGIEREIRRGSVGLKIGLIAQQICDLYIHLSPRSKLWDTCAPQIIIEEAGGKLTDLFGYPMRYDIADVQNHNGVAASNGAIHGETIRQLRPLLSKFGRFRVTPKE